jgi:hypothetical protein
MRYDTKHYEYIKSNGFIIDVRGSLPILINGMRTWSVESIDEGIELALSFIN